RAVRASRDNLALAADVGSESMQLTAFRHFRMDLDAYIAIAEKARTPADVAWGEILAWKGAVFTRQAFLRDAGKDPALAPLVAELRQVSTRLAALVHGATVDAGGVNALVRERDRLEQKLAAAVA